MSKEYADKIQWFVILIIVVVLAAAFLGIPQWLTDWIVQWLISAIIGTIFSMVATAIVEAFTGDFLKTITLTFEVGDFKFSFTTFATATVIVKLCCSINSEKCMFSNDAHRARYLRKYKYVTLVENVRTLMI